MRARFRLQTITCHIPFHVTSFAAKETFLLWCLGLWRGGGGGGENLIRDLERKANSLSRYTRQASALRRRRRRKRKEVCLRVTNKGESGFGKASDRVKAEDHRPQGIPVVVRWDAL